ncbi:hypothetical protein NDU88_000967 [Pleurodeles waltl]|uniref:Uncharacterized protein n=1 Tax=Pleurodeles waltl TaxID=8319 RepID=A0AAV7VVL2_PLEWA|nr:hypothetical protein NDU88_000967 [Pleurodeles waltl]
MGSVFWLSAGVNVAEELAGKRDAQKQSVVPLFRASLMLLRVREAAVHVSYWGNYGRASTGLKLPGKKRRTLRIPRKKIDELASRTAILEEEVGELRMVVEENKEQIKYLKEGEAGVMAKMESLENNQRRNNLRFLRVLEEGDLKGFMARLIKQEVNVEESE